MSKLPELNTVEVSVLGFSPKETQNTHTSERSREI